MRINSFQVYHLTIEKWPPAMEVTFVCITKMAPDDGWRPLLFVGLTSVCAMSQRYGPAGWGYVSAADTSTGTLRSPGTSWPM